MSKTTVEAMAELRAAFLRALTFDSRDFLAAAFWCAGGYCIGGAIWLAIALITSLPVRSDWAGPPIIVGAALGLWLWWYLRNAGNESGGGFQ